VPIINDTLYEDVETFQLNLSNPSPNGIINDGQGVCTINDGDTYDFSIEASKSVLESAGSVTFTVTLDQPVFEAVSVDYATADGTATAGSDYTATSGTLNFAISDTISVITIPIIDDGDDESDEETFNITLTPVIPLQQTVSNSPATCTITDDECLLTLNKTVDNLAIVVTVDGNITAPGSWIYT